MRLVYVAELRSRAETIFDALNAAYKKLVTVEGLARGGVGSRFVGADWSSELDNVDWLPDEVRDIATDFVSYLRQIEEPLISLAGRAADRLADALEDVEHELWKGIDDQLGERESSDEPV